LHYLFYATCSLQRCLTNNFVYPVETKSSPLIISNMNYHKVFFGGTLVITTLLIFLLVLFLARKVLSFLLKIGSLLYVLFFLENFVKSVNKTEQSLQLYKSSATLKQVSHPHNLHLNNINYIIYTICKNCNGRSLQPI